MDNKPSNSLRYILLIRYIGQSYNNVIRERGNKGGEMNNCEKIKNMSVDEMVEFIKNERCFDDCFNLDCSTCKDEIKQWLLAESEE